MKEQTIVGNFLSLVFYYPLGQDQLHAQIYDNRTDEWIDEDVVETQEDYDFFIKVFITAENRKSKTQNISSKFV